MISHTERQLMQERGLNILARTQAFKFDPAFFPYTSGEIGPYVVRCGNIQRDPANYDRAVNDLATLAAEITRDYDKRNLVISGGESMDWIFSTHVAIKLLAPSVMLYKNGRIEGEGLCSRRVLHIADLNNEGTSPKHYWVPLIREKGGKIEDIVFYVDRMEDGVEEMNKLGLKRHAIVELDSHAWDYLNSRGLIDKKIYKSIFERGKTKQERDAWAVKMLKSHVGLERLASLLNSPQTRDKAIKVIEIGYPQLRDQLIESLRKDHGLEIY